MQYRLLILIFFLLLSCCMEVREASFLQRSNGGMHASTSSGNRRGARVWFRSIGSIFTVGQEKIRRWTKRIQKTLTNTPVIMLPPLGLFLLSTSRCEASPLNPQRIAIGGPFFQGWLIRTIDHTESLSMLLIIGSFSSPKLSTYNEHYVFCGLQHGEQSQVVEAFPSPDSVNIDSTAQSSSNTQGLHVQWRAEGLGYFRFTDEECTGCFDFAKDNVKVHFNASARIPWSQQRMSLPGPEGWLAYTNLLPCHYFIYSVGSVTDYDIKYQAVGTSRTREVSGSGYSHIEGNHGTFFPKGWTWSQGIGVGNNSSYSLVSGIFEIGMISPMTTCLYLRRSNGQTAVFRTIDLDQVQYHLDGVQRYVRIHAKSWTKRSSVNVRIDLTDNSAHRVHIPTAEGFSNSPGCIESYTAKAIIEYHEDGNSNAEVYEFPLAALEFGNSFLGKVHSNIH